MVGDKKGIKYPKIRDVSDAVIAIRSMRLPDPAEIGNAGSFFKNPIVDQSVVDLLKTKFEKFPNYPAPDGKIKLAAGWLIEQAGWKGKRIKNCGTWPDQPLVIVNYGGSTGQEILDFSQKIQHSVSEKFGIYLQKEVNVV